MIAIPLLVALLFGTPQDSTAPAPDSSPSVEHAGSATAPKQLTPQQEAEFKQKAEEIRLQHEPARQEAIRINALAANIRSVADARRLVDAVAEQVSHQKIVLWAAQSYRRRVAHAEYEAVANPSGLIPESRIVNIWNEYVREIDAPQETLITVSEFHAFRRTQLFTTIRYQWTRDLSQSVWTMPNIFARNPDGDLQDGCRALEALKLFYEMHERFANLRIARDRLAKGLPFPDVTKKPPSEPGLAKAQIAGNAGNAALHATGVLSAINSPYSNPIRPAVYRYQQEHGEKAYDQLLRRLFDELFPSQ